MYVIFPAEEVVYYGYQLISATGQRSDPSISLDNHDISSLSRDSSLEQGPLQQSPCGSVRNSSNSNKCNKKPTSSNIRKHSRSETSRKQGLKHKVSKSEPNSPLFSHNNSLKTASSDNKRTPNLSLRSNRDLTSQKSNLNISFDLSDKYNYNPSEKSPNLTTPSPSLIIDPDPRLQLSNLQKERVPEKLPKRRIFFSSKKSITIDSAKMASSTEATLRELTHPSFNEHMKAHNSVTFKLVKTVSDFTQQLSQIYEHHAEELQLLVENFRKRNGELRKERPACPSSLFHTWETLLQEVEIDSQNHSDIASILGRQVSRPLLERSFHRKIQSRKVFTHRESYETIISKTEEKLAKCRQDYKNAYFAYLSAPTTSSLSAYFDTHNAYVQQLHATNGMLNEYSKDTLPQLLQELEEIYADLCTSVADAVLQGAEVVSQRAIDQSRRYEVLSSQCRAVSGPTDLAHFARALPQPPHNRPIMKRLFNPPQPPVVDPNAEPGADGERPFEQLNEKNIPPPLKNELVIDRLSSVQVKPSYDALRKESTDLELQIKQIKDALDTLIRIQQRSLESNLFNKVNEIQEDISIKRFDLSVAQIHLSAINSQKELFANKMDLGDTGRERKMSSSSTGSMKSKWLKAFKSLKTPPSSASTSPKENEKKNGSASSTRSGMVESDAHTFQEYTYKKITPCDICSQVLRGHTHQGLRCRVCKINVHIDCQDKVGKCQVKSRLLRRQKSTSEIDARVPETANEEESAEDSYFPYPRVSRQFSIKDTHSRVTSPDLERMPTSGSGTRPFGQPLCLMLPLQENGNNQIEVNTKPHSPSPKITKKASKKSK